MWPAVLLAAAGCYLLKLAGLSIPQRILDNPVLERVAALLPIALLCALAAIAAFTEGKDFDIDERAAGMVVAITAIALRAPFLVVVGAASATTALLRAVF